ncbi:MAG TPA: NnrU family protein, partial [Woeseiaceae bacterium]|nr:NnrU family protein [Woeseiaceae bacterium]
IPPPWFNRPAALAMPLAFILLAAAYIPGNIKRIVRHPMLAGILVWATVHLVANGDLASLLLFGSFAAYALLDILAVSVRVATRSVAKRPLYMDAIGVVGGLVVFRVVRHYHGALFGVPVTY